jgi:two-component system sensor histidine kinase KdpD
MEQLGDLEIIPRRTMQYRDSTFEEMDVDAILARQPAVALVDELAHTNVPGGRHEKRCQDVNELLEAGIDVITTVNIQHLESLNDVVEGITGIKQRETIPDEIVRAAEQVQLVDSTPEELRRRMAHGNIYAPEKVDSALANYFRPGNLAALRELALLWLADKVDDGLEEYRQRHGITAPWETRERVVVALTGAPSTSALIRRGARIAQRAHGELLGVNVRGEEGLTGPPTALMEDHRKLLLEMGGEYHEVAGNDVAAALVDFARAENATQLVLGASRRSRWAEISRGSIINRVVRLSGAIDVHVISQEVAEANEGSGPRPRRRALSPIPARRRAIGWSFAALGVPLLTAALTPLRDSTSLSTVLLLYLALIVATAAVGGTLPALLTAVAAFLTANWYFTPPIHQWTIDEGENVVALAVFLSVALVVSRFVDAAARRAGEAARARTEATTLARLAATIGEADPLPALLNHLRSVFGLTGAALLRKGDSTWHVEASAGEPVPQRPEDGDVVEELAPGVVLAITGPRIAAEDHAVLNAFASQLAVVLEHGRLRVEAGRAHALADANALRTALLHAVSHDLRTPLASIKAAATSLSQDDVQWSPDEASEFLRTINEETDRLITLVGNLLDMSRIQAGALQPALRPVALEEVVPSAVLSLGPRAAVVDAQIAETLPPVLADPALLERAIANVIENAARLSPTDRRVRVEAGAFDGHIDLRVIDQGPGIPRDQRDLVFQPFQRLGDNQAGTGVGLGLAVARGFLSAIGGTIEIDDTPGGGTTVVISLAIAT